MSFMLALITAVVGVVPLLIARKFGAAIITAFIAELLCWWIYWGALPSLVWPLFGAVGLMIFILWIVSAAIVSAGSGPSYPWLFPIVGILLYIITGIGGCGAFRSGDYARLIGDVEKREWTQDVQPKDPKHIRLVPEELAKFSADKQLGEAPGAIGSQFHVAKEYMTLQMIKDELW